MLYDDGTMQREVIAELAMDPRLAALEIGVAVRAAVVTLSGSVDSAETRDAVVRAANRVPGVKAIAEELAVLGRGVNRTDTELAHAVVNALQWERSIPLGIRARVDEGHVWLDGVVDTDQQKAAAERAVQTVTGVRQVHNEIAVRRPVSAPNEPA
jgi:osmotically-inducible protein OsmY